MTSEPLILAVETSSRVGSVALAQGPRLLAESEFSAPMQHSAEIFPAIDRLLQRHARTAREIEQVHLSSGPGSFTGLRIAVTLAKSMHLAHRTRIVTVDSLDVVMANLSDTRAEPQVTVPGTVAALFDAKRGQFYTAVYSLLAAGQDGVAAPGDGEPGYQIPGPYGGAWHKVLADCLITAPEIVARFATAGPIGVLGDGLLYHREEFRVDSVVTLPERYWSPHAANVHRLGYQKALAGRFDDPLTLTPFYLRGPHVTLKQTP